MSAPRLTEEIKVAILAAYSAGEKLTVIAARFGCDQSYPTILACRRGVALRSERHIPSAEVSLAPKLRPELPCGIRAYTKRVPNRTALGDFKTDKALNHAISLPYVSILGEVGE
jgi:hypothetical protein